MFYVKYPMFYVEHQVGMRILVIFFIMISLVGCNKPNPNPELMDEIYHDLKSQAENTQKQVEAEKKKLEGLRKELDTATPQSGTIKHSQKVYFESEFKIQKLEQLAKYYEFKTESRKKYTNLEYLKSFKAGKPWPTEEELLSYKQYKESMNAEKSWDTKKRVQNYKKINGITSESPEIPKKSDKKSEATKKAE
jgi:hypothetical protein